MMLERDGLCVMMFMTVLGCAQVPVKKTVRSFFFSQESGKKADNGSEDSGIRVAADSSEELHHATSKTLPGTIECCAVHGQTRCSGSATRHGLSANWVRACAGNGTIRSEFAGRVAPLNTILAELTSGS